MTHFSPGSHASRPYQATGIPNFFVAGDWVKGLEHGANGLSQVCVWGGEHAWLPQLRLSCRGVCKGVDLRLQHTAAATSDLTPGVTRHSTGCRHHT